MNSFVSSASSLACCAARPDLRARRQDLRGSRRAAPAVETPGFAATAISSSLPSFWKSRCAVGRSKPASVAPPIERTEPNSTIPEMRSVVDRPLDLDADRRRRPRSPPCSAVAASIDDLVRPGPGALDERQRVEASSRRSGDREAEVRRAAEDDRLAVLADQRGRSLSTLPSASATPSSPRTSSSSDSSNGRLGRRRSPPRGRTPTCPVIDDVGALADVGEDRSNACRSSP